MPFFQNVFTTEFDSGSILADRQFSLRFFCPGNAGRGDELVKAWTAPNAGGTYNFSGNDAEGDAKDTLNLYFAIDTGSFKNWTLLSVDVTTEAASAAAATVQEVVNSLNEDTEFACWFTAENRKDTVIIRQKKPVTNMKFYVANGQAETVLGFNARASVAELPSYMDRHTMENRFNFVDSLNMLIKLDPSNDVDADVIDNATDIKGNSLGYDHSDVTADWELLKGTSGMFTFKKNTVDGSNRITQIIEYRAGAIEGDFAKKTIMTYTGANTTPDKVVEIPYVLTNSDLVTP